MIESVFCHKVEKNCIICTTCTCGVVCSTHMHAVSRCNHLWETQFFKVLMRLASWRSCHSFEVDSVRVFCWAWDVDLGSLGPCFLLQDLLLCLDRCEFGGRSDSFLMALWDNNHQKPFAPYCMSSSFSRSRSDPIWVALVCRMWDDATVGHILYPQCWEAFFSFCS